MGRRGSATRYVSRDFDSSPRHSTHSLFETRIDFISLGLNVLICEMSRCLQTGYVFFKLAYVYPSGFSKAFQGWVGMVSFRKIVLESTTVYVFLPKIQLLEEWHPSPAPPASTAALLLCKKTAYLSPAQNHTQCLLWGTHPRGTKPGDKSTTVDSIHFHEIYLQ